MNDDTYDIGLGNFDVGTSTKINFTRGQEQALGISDEILLWEPVKQEIYFFTYVSWFLENWILNLIITKLD